jgi:hypothetical protein
MSVRNATTARAQDFDLACGFLLHSGADPGSKHLKIVAFVENDGYEQGEKVIFGFTEIWYLPSRVITRQ